MSFHRKITVVFVFIVLLILSACGVEDEYWEEDYPEGPEDCPADMVYDEEWEECVYPEELEEGGGFLDLLDGMFTDSTEDCFEDETYDAELEQCVYNGEDFEEVSLLDFLGDVVGSFSMLDAGLGDGDVLVTYTVSGDNIQDPVYAEVSDDLIAAQKDIDSQEAAWAYFTSLIPADGRQQIVQFMVFTDGEDETLAYVEPLADDLKQWRLALDIADTKDTQDLTMTLIHEYGHVLTLNSAQITGGQEACSTYQNQEGCTLPQSYLNIFIDEFWGELMDEYLEIDSIQDDNAYYNALDDFYAKYQDQFVTDYAATNPEEDIAESWAYFILHPRPAGDTIAEQKILFFYDYPELVALREEIVSRTVSRVRRSN